MKFKLIIFLSLIFLIGCEKEELPNELFGTKWEQRQFNSSNGMQYYPETNSWEQYWSSYGTITQLIFTGNHNGTIEMTDYYSRTARGVTTRDTTFIGKFDVTYNFDSTTRKGRLQYTVVFNYNGDEVTDNVDEEFGLFFDNDDLWLKNRNNVFIEIKAVEQNAGGE